MRCSSCGLENPEIASFCMACGTSLKPSSEPPGREERKVISVLFCDLVGFTASSEAADPEDVRARLQPYHELLRTEIQRYGGTVEKFIGDAVMAVFGAPVAHEDDPERAIRAGLRILDALADLNAERNGMDLHVRIGINTGEGIVALDARPELGEGLVTGDVVNTSSRLQSVAPVDGVAVGEPTYEATAHIFDFEELPPAELKGKAEPVRHFHAKAALARFGSELLRQHETPLVGREIDLGILRGAFEKTVAGSTVQLVTIVGEPGVGKSRLVTELYSYIDALPEVLVRMRTGRCLSYGDSITFWALGEIVKWEAGILESDDPATAARKLDALVADDIADSPWLRQRLRPLVGLEAPEASREENFTGWLRYLELLAEDAPLIAVFEDLHWADEALLEFIEHVAEFAEGVPLLLIGTARPELHARVSWGGKLRNLLTINLTPLSEADTMRLISNLLEQAVLPSEVQRAILERAGGNPLYAEEFVRLLKDRRILAQQSGLWRLDGSAEIPMPSGVQGMIAARIDTLDVDDKALLQDASVIGRVFWSGAVSEINDRDPVDVEQRMHELSRRELVRAVRRSSVEGEREFTFWHALVRDVAYGQIPRAVRSAKHVAAARWIERVAGDRVEDHAEILASHYVTALDLLADDAPERDRLQERAVRNLALAGDRALGLDIESAERDYRRALELIAANDRGRPELLIRHARALLQRAEFAAAGQEFEEAIDAFRRVGDERGVAVATINGYQSVLGHLGSGRERVVVAEAVEILERDGPNPDLVRALSNEARDLELRGNEHDAAIDVSDRAIAMASDLGLPEPARAIEGRGLARMSAGDPGGLDDMHRALELAKAQGLGRDVDVIQYNLADAAGSLSGPAEKLALDREGFAKAVDRGDAEFALSFRQAIVSALTDLGSWDEALSLAESLTEDLERAGEFWDLADLENNVAIIHEHRGDLATARALIEHALQTLRETTDPQLLISALTTAAAIEAAAGAPDGAMGLLDELAAVPFMAGEWGRVLPQAVRTAVVLDVPLAERLIAGQRELPGAHTLALWSARGTLAEVTGDFELAVAEFERAADGWTSFGMPYEAAQAFMGFGRCFKELGRSERASEMLRIASGTFGELRATPAHAKATALLAQTLEKTS
jgi:class 3 adenylate cyclase/tetratricopeptide (TPR) repeat protein